MTGGAGADVFALYSGSTTILDFGNGADKLAFTFGLSVATAPLPETQFVSGAGVTAGDGTQQIIYDTSTGNLYYEDGVNPDAAVQIATLIGTPALSASDIEIFGAF